MATKRIVVVMESGASVDGRWYESDGGEVYADGTQIGTAKTIKDAIAILETHAEKAKSSRVKRVDIQ